MNKLGRGPLCDATYQISGSRPCVFRHEDFFTFFQSEAKNAYIMSGIAANEIYFFLASQDEINGIFKTKI